MKAGIIGGTGKMGRLFAPVFERAGYEILVSGRSTALTNEELAETCDIVIVSVPIRDTVRVIGEIAPVMRDDQLLCDFTSLKVAPVAAMLRSKAQVIGLHPMFGPTVSSIAGQTIVVCPARTTDAALDYLQGIFTREGAVCTLATPEEHDRMMAVVQGLTHFVTICMADTIRRLGTDIRATEAYMSPVYQIELCARGAAPLAGPGALCRYPRTEPLCARSDCRLPVGGRRPCGIVKSGDPDAFAEFFRQDTRHLGDLLQARAGPDRCPHRVHGEEMTVITLGPEGTFSHELALKLGCDPVVLEPTIHSIFAASRGGRGGRDCPDRELRGRGGGRDPRRSYTVPLLDHCGDVHADPSQPRLARAARQNPGDLRPPADPRTVQRVHREMEGPGDPYEQQRIKRHRGKKDPERRGDPLSLGSRDLPHAQ